MRVQISKKRDWREREGLEEDATRIKMNSSGKIGGKREKGKKGKRKDGKMNINDR